ncbi:MAG: glycosyltransferase family 4 protein, partial [Ilumatobacter sp.]
MMVTDFYWPLLGGVEQHVRSLSHELCARSHRVTVVTMDHGGSPAAEQDGPVDVVRIPTTTQRLERLFRQPRPWAPPIHDPSAALRLRQLVADRRPDVVHGHDWLARSVIGSTADRPLVSTLHYYPLSCAKKDLMRDGEPCAGPGPAKCVACAARHYGVLKGTVTAAAQAAGSALERRATDHTIAVSRATATGNGLALDD